MYSETLITGTTGMYSEGFSDRLKQAMTQTGSKQVSYQMTTQLTQATNYDLADSNFRQLANQPAKILSLAAQLTNAPPVASGFDTTFIGTALTHSQLGLQELPFKGTS